MPPAVTGRAWEVLLDLERSAASSLAGSKRRTRNGGPAWQMPLFNPTQPIVDELRSLDIPNLTPLEAINKLYELQGKAQDLDTGSRS
jgi:DNA mismatch repair protein MutS